MLKSVHDQTEDATSLIPPVSTSSYMIEAGIATCVAPAYRHGDAAVVPSTEAEDSSDIRPAKRRRLDESAGNRKRDPNSPPWKKVSADGPSSFTQNGIRKSGRTNLIPVEMQASNSQRQTRGAQSKSQLSKLRNDTKDRRTGTTGGTKATAKSSPANERNRRRALRQLGAFANGAEQAQHNTSSLPASLRTSRRASSDSRPRDSHTFRKDPHNIPQSIAASVPKSQRSRKSSGRADDTALKPEETPRSKLSRIKFRVKPTILSLTHPASVSTRPRAFSNLQELLDKGGSVPVEAGGLWDPDDDVQLNHGTLIQDAQIVVRAETASRLGGILARETCAAFVPEVQDEPARQFAHLDHLNRAAIGFRKLMVVEHRRHQMVAKKVAELCKEEWYRRQPKSDAELLYDQQLRWRTLYQKGVVKSLQDTWDNVRAEINRRRLAEWEVSEQARVRKALNEAVDKSTQQLQARQALGASTDASEDDTSSESDGSGRLAESGGDNDLSGDQSDVLSTDTASDSDSVSDATANDETLSTEQLRQKYKLDSPSMSAVDDFDDQSIRKTADVELFNEMMSNSESDESIDMDDDLGSSDDDTDEGSDGSAASDSASEGASEVQASEVSMLGFLMPSEVKALSIRKSTEDAQGEGFDKGDETSQLLKNSSAHTKQSEDTMEDSHDREVSNRLGSPDLRDPTERQRDDATNSPAQSSQPTPITIESKPSDIESVSSLEPLHAQTHSRDVSTPISIRTSVPSLLRGSLREYQHYGLDWLARLYANHTNGILADEMGLGKTIQSIALLAHLACEHGIWGPHLVIVPTSVMLNWEMEFKKFCPGFKILTYYGTQEERRRKRAGWRSEDTWNVCITSYQLILQDQQVFKRRRWHYMILDEAHNIKNFQSLRWQTMLTFNTRARLLLTGTPLQNNLTELWSLLYFLMPSDGTGQGVGGFTNLQEFQNWFKKPADQILEQGREKMDEEARAIVTKLHKVLRPYLLRRLKADVEKQMPGKYEHVELCRLSKRQRELYDNFLGRRDTQDTLSGGNYLSIINCLMQLRKVCNHPDLFLDRPITTSFPIQHCVAAKFEHQYAKIRRWLDGLPMTKVSMAFLNLMPSTHEDLPFSPDYGMYSAQRAIVATREALRARAQQASMVFDPSTVRSSGYHLKNAGTWSRFEDIQHLVYVNALRRQQRPMYGTRLIDLLTLDINLSVQRPKPRKRSDLLNWLTSHSSTLSAMVLSLWARSLSMHETIRKFACVTPAVITRDLMSFLIPVHMADMVQISSRRLKKDPFHEARMRLSVQFPDKRLLQYDCGKLQVLDKLLRKLQAGGHRALIFTQMTRVLDILEQFLNIHGHKYLRLDGATKIEQRQVLTDRFNNDPRILVFILSSRSGGLGINLTGADTVIFYDLDWNPAMDKQCQDRCHRIGQTRDVHIYRLVSEHTIEANILRKANQKRMLDDVVIQEGDFTTEQFSRNSGGYMPYNIEEDSSGDAAANAAMDRVLGTSGDIGDVRRVLAQAEDREDVTAANIAEKEELQANVADFNEASGTEPADQGPGTLRLSSPSSRSNHERLDERSDDRGVYASAVGTIDDYLLGVMDFLLRDSPIEFPQVKSRNRRGKDGRHPSHRPRR